MMLFSLHNQTHTTECLRPISGFLRSSIILRGILNGVLPVFDIAKQGRKPSGIVWSDLLFGTGNGRDSYLPASNNNDEPADANARNRCRSHSERFNT